MGQMLVRNIEDWVLADLRRRATQQGTSVEEQARRVLTASSRHERRAWLARVDAIRESVGPMPGPSTLDDIRADRYGDE